MKNGRYFKKKNFKKIIGLCLFPIILMVGLTFIMGFYYKPNVYVRLQDVTVELGDKLPEEITKYMAIMPSNSNLKIEVSAPLDEYGNTKMIGKFGYYLVYDDDDYKISRLTNVRSTITVIDTINPVIKPKENVKVEYNGSLTVDDIAECIDLSGCKMEYTPEIDTTASGEYEVTITAYDGAKNMTTATAKVTVLEKPKPVVVYNYNPYAGMAYQNINDHNNRRNEELSEEEKNNLRYAVVNFATQFVGNPYVYGGTSLTNGTDCSGFTMSVYANFGYALPRSAIEQSYIGTPVSPAELMPGDLIVYMHGHVGIYIGNGMMVHAGTSATGITTQPMYDGYRVYRRVIY